MIKTSGARPLFGEPATGAEPPAPQVSPGPANGSHDVGIGAGSVAACGSDAGCGVAAGASGAALPFVDMHGS